MRRLRPPAAAAKMHQEEGCHMQRAKKAFEGLRIPTSASAFLDRHLYRARRVPGRRRRRRLLADLHSHRTDAHAPGRRSPGRPVPFRRCELPHWTASAASFMLSGAALLYFRVSFRPKRRRHHDGRGRAHGRLLRSVLPALGDVLRNRRPATRPICIPLSAAMSVALFAHSPFTARCRSPWLPFACSS